MIPHTHRCSACNKDWECHGYENDDGVVEDCSCIDELQCGPCAIAHYEKLKVEGSLSDHGYLSKEQSERFIELVCMKGVLVEEEDD